jgi:hypothetical protein
MWLNLTPIRPLTATFDILEARARNRLARLSSAAIRSELKEWSARAGLAEDTQSAHPAENVAHRLQAALSNAPPAHAARGCVCE